MKPGTSNANHCLRFATVTLPFSGGAMRVRRSIRPDVDVNADANVGSLQSKPPCEPTAHAQFEIVNTENLDASRDLRAMTSSPAHWAIPTTTPGPPSEKS